MEAVEVPAMVKEELMEEDMEVVEEQVVAGAMQDMAEVLAVVLAEEEDMEQAVRTVEVTEEEADTGVDMVVVTFTITPDVNGFRFEETRVKNK